MECVEHDAKHLVEKSQLSQSLIEYTSLCCTSHKVEVTKLKTNPINCCFVGTSNLLLYSITKAEPYNAVPIKELDS